MSLSLGKELCECAPLHDWVAKNVYCLPHQNQAVEGHFNVWDDLKTMSGPRLKKASMERKMKTYANKVRAERPATVSAQTGKAMQYNWTKDEVQAITNSTVTSATAYTDELMARALLDDGQRREPDHMGAIDVAAARSQPERRTQCDEVAEASQLVMPRAGFCHS